MTQYPKATISQPIFDPKPSSSIIQPATDKGTPTQPLPGDHPLADDKPR